MTGAAARQRGFTLLEAIVAMTLFASAAILLFGWQAQSVDTLRRVGERQAYVESVRAALPLVLQVNPMAEPTGSRVAGDLHIRWTATAIDGPKPGRTPIGNASLFDVGLYSVDVDVRRGEIDVGRFNVRLAGFRQVRSVVEP
ncbi:type II secretion system protein [Silanimonas sp.]|jgi:general secretion pathway protein I|uniref:PulJ/GspJ family protein n=1 Tax=Silanimonas sp. TaxID=1929290 RepID=UPI0022C88268|nr:type II secretion system protein [Silanimonas sp.]MCZ8114235.1 type II secretion system protein [Silanimonas sp.]